MGWLSTLDRLLYALFSRHADHPRHDRDRRNYRAAAFEFGFDTYLARVYGSSWLVAIGIGGLVGILAMAVPDAVVTTVGQNLHAATPGLNRIDVSAPPRPYVAAIGGIVFAIVAKRGVLWLGSRVLGWRAEARRSDIRRTLPGAVRYLRALADGSDDRRTMLEKVAAQDAYGETSVEFERVLEKATLTGSLDAGLRGVARDTPSRNVLSPFLLKFREHASQGSDALNGYLRMEARMLSNQEARQRQRASDLLELLAELFIVLLVIPALLVVVVTVMSVLAPSLSQPTGVPGNPSVRAVLIYGSGGFVLVVGALAALLVDQLRPPGHAPTYGRPGGAATIVTAPVNPSSAAIAFLPLAFLVGGGLWVLGYTPENVVLLGYAAYGIPVGGVAVRRARLDDAKDREIRDFIHAVAGHVSLGRPFPTAVERVAADVDFGGLQSDIGRLAFILGLTNPVEGDVRKAALNSFVDDVGTPLAEQTVGLVTGALEVGSDPESTFETLQTEVGQLYHQRKSIRATMLIYVTVGWTTAILIVGIVVAVNAYVLEGFAQLSTVSSGVAIDPNAVDVQRDAWRFYLVTQATMLACGWFAGSASRGRYEALLHSSVLVVICYGIFAGVGVA